MAIGQKITPFLWFDNQAEEAVGFYTSIFKNSQIVTVSRYGDAGPGPKGSILAIAFELEGQDFSPSTAGRNSSSPRRSRSTSIARRRPKSTQYWSKLVDGGEERECGWLKDRYGLSWQIIPPASAGHDERQPTARKRDRVMQAMLQDEEDRHPAAEGRLQGTLGGAALESR